MGDKRTWSVYTADHKYQLLRPEHRSLDIRLAYSLLDDSKTPQLMRSVYDLKL